MRTARALGGCCLCLYASGCSWAFDARALGAERGATDTTDAGDVANVRPQADASNGPPSPLDSAAPCPSRASMIRVGTFCIDRRETTVAEYRVFTQAVDGGGPPAPGCEAAVDRRRGSEWSLPSDDLPVGGVSYCDAHAYCSFVGKRLCGARSDAKLRLEQFASAEQSEWFYACSQAGRFRFPYGEDEIAGACATNNRMQIFGDRTCEGGYPGLFDMVGNVMEWVDACTGDGEADLCAAVGGSLRDPGADCLSTRTMVRTQKYDFAGIRCCAP